MNKSRGFSLIELLVVLVILGMLGGLVGPRLFNKVDSSKVDTAETQVRMLRAALQTYRLDVGSYPVTEQGLAALISNPSSLKKWDGPYLDDQLPQDPWGNPYIFRNTNSSFELLSPGPDGKLDTKDDLRYTP